MVDALAVIDEAETSDAACRFESLEKRRMQHRNIITEEWSRMAIASLFERGRLPDWREFVQALTIITMDDVFKQYPAPLLR